MIAAILARGVAGVYPAPILVSWIQHRQKTGQPFSMVEHLPAEQDS